MRFGKRQILSALFTLAFVGAVVMAALWAESAGDMGKAGGTRTTGDTENAEDTGSTEDTADIPGSSGFMADGAGNGDTPGRAGVDFDRLQIQNEDIYAWITVPGTGIDYPVLQKGDAKDPYDNSYLDHQVDLSEGFPGVIYSQPVNQRDFTDSLTVLYGHNLKNGGMFSELHEFEDEDFFLQNDKIVIYTPEKILTYEIFAAIDFSDALLTYEYDFTKNAEVWRHLADVRRCQGNFREGAEISEGDRILVLSTCYSDKPERRLLVEAVLAEEEAGN